MDHFIHFVETVFMKRISFVMQQWKEKLLIYASQLFSCCWFKKNNSHFTKKIISVSMIFFCSNICNHERVCFKLMCCSKISFVFKDGPPLPEEGYNDWPCAVRVNSDLTFFANENAYLYSDDEGAFRPVANPMPMEAFDAFCGAATTAEVRPE